MKEEKARSVEVILLGQKYSLKTTESDEFLSKVVDLLNSEFEALRKLKPSASPMDIVMLSAMKITSKHIKDINAQRARIDGLLKKSDEFISYIDSRLTDQ